MSDEQTRGRGRIFGRRRQEQGDAPFPPDGEGDDFASEDRPRGSSRASDSLTKAGRPASDFLLTPEEHDENRRAREREIAERKAREEAERLRIEQERRDAELARLTMWTDTHCHLQYGEEPDAVDLAIARALEAGVRRMVCVGTDAASSREAIEIAVGQTRPGAVSASEDSDSEADSESRADSVEIEVYATAGLHPHEARHGTAELRELVSSIVADTVRSSRLVAIGECGLDFYYDHSPRSTQRTVFEEQIDLANQHDLALVIHTREAFADTLKCLRSRGVPKRTIFHCFTGGPADAERCLELGAYLSFSGIATFASAAEVRESAVRCPADRLLIETDSPYLTPVPNRGKPNEPRYVPLVGEAIARARGIDPQQLARITSDNAIAAFRLPATPVSAVISY